MYWETRYKLMSKSKEKYQFYFGSYSYKDYSKGKISKKIPRQHLGWAKRAVDIRANKTNFDRFENDTLNLNEIFSKYKVIEAFNKIKDDVLVCGCGFLALHDDRVYPFTAEEATGTYDWKDQNLEDGVAVFKEYTEKSSIVGTPDKSPDRYIEYFRDKTVLHNKDEDIEEITQNCTGRPLMGVLTHKSTAKRPFGKSVISQPAREAILDASRTVRQSMIASYHYNTKVDVVLGVDNETEINRTESQTGDIITIGSNENGQIPQISEFAQHGLRPFNDTIDISARNFCAETKLGLANLSISTNAPQSSEALEIINDDLRDDIVSWHDELGEQLKHFAVTLYMYENNLSELDENIIEKIRAIKPVFYSVYRQDVSRFGDGLVKIAQQAPDIVKSRELWRGLGLPSEDIDMIVKSAENARMVQYN